MPIKHHNTKKYKILEYIHSNIFVVENVIDNQTCKNMISDIEKNNSEKLVFTNGNNVECYKVKDESKITEYFVNKIKELLDELSFIINIPINGICDIEIRKVYGETRLHTDGTCPNIALHPTRNHSVKLIRSLTVVGALNDDYEGGEYNFPSQNLKIKLKAGSFIFFPPYWTHPHSVSKIIKIPNCNEYRYIVSTWAIDNSFIKYIDDVNINNIIVL
jgi:hypothetical protein